MLVKAKSLGQLSFSSMCHRRLAPLDCLTPRQSGVFVSLRKSAGPQPGSGAIRA